MACSFHCTACREEIVNDEDILVGFNSVGVYVEGVGAVFEIVCYGMGFIGEFIGFSDGNEADGESLRQWYAEEETARFDACDGVDCCVFERFGHLVDSMCESEVVEQKGGDIFEDNAWFWPIFNIADK